MAIELAALARSTSTAEEANRVDLYYVILDCFPDRNSRFFMDVAGAIAGCWITSADSIADAVAFAKSCVEKEGWRVACIVEGRTTTRATELEHDCREEVRQAILDGIAVTVRWVTRETIDADTGELPVTPAALQRSGELIIQRGAWSLYSETDEQWANGITNTGNDFMPMWSDRASCVNWKRDWPGYAVRRISPVQLARRMILDRLATADMWVGLGVGRNTLVLAHPAWLRSQLPGG